MGGVSDLVTTVVEATASEHLERWTSAGTLEWRSDVVGHGAEGSLGSDGRCCRLRDSDVLMENGARRTSDPRPLGQFGLGWVEIRLGLWRGGYSRGLSVMSFGKIMAVVLGALGVLAGVALVGAAVTVLAEDRDDDGFYVTDEYRFDRSSHAIVSEDLDLLTDAPGWVIDLLADPVDLRLEGTSGAGGGLFVGIAPTADVAEYLSGVAHDEVTNLDIDDSTVFNVEYQSHDGTTTPAPPANQSFWSVSSEGGGSQSLVWPMESGNWTVVMMNTDGSAGVDAEVVFGAKISNIRTVAWSVLGFGLVSLLGAGFLLYLGFRKPRRSGPSDRAVDLGDSMPPVNALPGDDVSDSADRPIESAQRPPG